ncbi:hypothetical protein ACTI_72420 [Actinoplanes sp. OR16]|uniref:WXG100-like domain-containing protein n=1 Tax=Actinoplanes sp. OR16 TaxID=946334 RepID=UPI000F6D128D|nr:hypothetical protein [Actinoplanes sp. OR16]BBH70557.1 hypothetical protein ACTI_72420 [Actinoplanes sp. OR16]
MVDLRGISEDVPFDWDAATHLAAQLRSSADECEGVVPRRTAAATVATEEWRGAYARQFATRMGLCVTDAQRLATAMRQAANQVDELARLAREEQNRREKAREWQRRQEEEGVLDKIGDFLFGEDDLPPVPDPITPPVYTAPPPAVAVRE